jgi:hypothetical protein
MAIRFMLVPKPAKFRGSYPAKPVRARRASEDPPPDVPRPGLEPGEPGGGQTSAITGANALHLTAFARLGGRPPRFTPLSGGGVAVGKSELV